MWAAARVGEGGLSPRFHPVSWSGRAMGQGDKSDNFEGTSSVWGSFASPPLPLNESQGREAGDVPPHPAASQLCPPTPNISANVELGGLGCGIHVSGWKRRS